MLRWTEKQTDLLIDTHTNRQIIYIDNDIYLDLSGDAGKSASIQVLPAKDAAYDNSYR